VKKQSGSMEAETGVDPIAPSRWRLSATSTAWRLFATCWLVYAIHASTDVVREHYPAVALADDFTFRLDDYGGLHPDLFEKPGYGWHIGNNPGISLFAAVPYFLSRPAVDRIVNKVEAGRAARGDTIPPAFNSPRALFSGVVIMLTLLMSIPADGRGRKVPSSPRNSARANRGRIG